MSRIKLELPDTFHFTTQISVRITDLNYGNHLSNDAYLQYMHEARMQFFAHYGFSEMDLAGVSVIMGDSAIVYKSECFYGDVLNIEVTASDFGPRSFDLYYKMTHAKTNQLVAACKTGMVCYDYASHKSVNVPESFVLLFR